MHIKHMILGLMVSSGICAMEQYPAFFESVSFYNKKGSRSNGSIDTLIKKLYENRSAIDVETWIFKQGCILVRCDEDSIFFVVDQFFSIDLMAHIIGSLKQSNFRFVKLQVNYATPKTLCDSPPGS